MSQCASGVAILWHTFLNLVFIMLQPTVATIQSPLFSERICAEINIHVNLDQSRPDLSHVTYRTMPRRPQPLAPSAL